MITPPEHAYPDRIAIFVPIPEYTDWCTHGGLVWHSPAVTREMQIERLLIALEDIDPTAQALALTQSHITVECDPAKQALVLDVATRFSKGLLP